MDPARPLVAQLRRLSLDDGPGLRTTVFLKGCPLNCSWCHNPETISPAPELMYFAEQCIACGRCLAACPTDALRGPAPPSLDRHSCTACGRCAEECPAEALRLVGRVYSVAQLVESLLRDRLFYDASGGGVTFSGGEPTFFPHYLSEVLKALRTQGVSTAIETAGTFGWRTFEAKLLPYLDLVLFDLKLADPAQHLHHTGRGNARIIANFVRLCEQTRVQVVPRTVLVPGVTDTRANLDAIARLVEGRRCGPLQLLPFNQAGLAKRRALG